MIEFYYSSRLIIRQGKYIGKGKKENKKHDDETHNKKKTKHQNAISDIEGVAMLISSNTIFITIRLHNIEISFRVIYLHCKKHP